MADFKKAFQRLMPIEGGYSNHPNDRGKETYKGISRKYWPNWRGWEVIDALRKEPGFPGNLSNHPGLQEMTEAFYQEQFWSKIHGDQIKSQAVAEELFDTAVNCGVRNAGYFAQCSLNILNRQAKMYDDIDKDGKIGPVTIKMLNQFDDEPILIRTLNSYQAKHYIELTEQDPTQEEFFRGWLKRAS